MGTTSVLIVEADPVRREGLVSSLSRHTDLRVVGAAPDLVGALRSVSSSSHIEFLLINVDQPESKEFRFWATLHLLMPATIRVVALCHGVVEGQLEALLAAGVFSLYPPDADPERISQAVKNASRGLMDYHPSLAEKVKLLLMQPPRERGVRIGDLALDQETGQVLRGLEPVRVTERERKILSLPGEVKTNREIAQVLSISQRTVAFHVGNILRKFGLSSRVEPGLVARWLQNHTGASTRAQDL